MPHVRCLLVIAQPVQVIELSNHNVYALMVTLKIITPNVINAESGVALAQPSIHVSLVMVIGSELLNVSVRITTMMMESALCAKYVMISVIYVI